MEVKFTVSATSANGKHIMDLTKLLSEAHFNLKLSNYGQADVIIRDINSYVFNKLNFLENHIRFEANYSNGQKEVVWQGPITSMPKTGDVDILADDKSIFWHHQTLTLTEFESQDSSQIAYQLLNAAFTSNYLSKPANILVQPSNYASSLQANAAAKLNDALRSLTGLAYTFFGDNLILFSSDGLEGEPLRFYQKDFIERIKVEQLLKYYATKVVVQGRGVIGVAESNSPHMISRRFDFPQIKSQDEVDAKAQELLTQYSGVYHINFETDLTLKFRKSSLKMSDLIPGRKCFMHVEKNGFSVIQPCLIDEVRVDVDPGVIKIGFVPQKNLTSSGV